MTGSQLMRVGSIRAMAVRKPCLMVVSTNRTRSSTVVVTSSGSSRNEARCCQPFEACSSRQKKTCLVIHVLVRLLCVVFVQHFGAEEPERTRSIFIAFSSVSLNWFGAASNRFHHRGWYRSTKYLYKRRLSFAGNTHRLEKY